LAFLVITILAAKFDALKGLFSLLNSFWPQDIDWPFFFFSGHQGVAAKLFSRSRFSGIIDEKNRPAH